MVTDIAVHLPAPHQAQRSIIDGASRFNTVCCGRRFGKSVLAINRLVQPAIGGKPVAYFAPTYPMLTEIWRELRQILQPMTTRVDAQQHRIELIGGGVVDMWSLDSVNAPRGRKYAGVAIDEAAMVPHLEEAWNAVIRPTLADYRGFAWLFSTPKGRNYFWQMWQWGQDAGRPEWASWQMPTSANPYIDPDEIAAMAATMPERTYQQEILAQFLEDGNGVFRRVSEAACAIPPRERQRHTYVAGVDWGKSNDWTVIIVKDADTGAFVDMDRFNQIDWEIQRGRVKAMVAKWQITTLLAERNSIGDPNIEALQRDGVPVTGFITTNATKGTAIEQFALNIETGATTFPDWPVLIAELQAYEMERLPSGLVRYSAPPGMHDDCVIAGALADVAAAKPKRQSMVFDRQGRRTA